MDSEAPDTSADPTPTTAPGLRTGPGPGTKPGPGTGRTPGPAPGPPWGLRLADAYKAWSRRPWHHHALAVAALAALLALRWAPALTSPEPLADERIYLSAVAKVMEGKSPAAAHGYLYFPFLAITGAWQAEILGPMAVAWEMRLANLLGLALTAWCALAWSPWGRWRKVLVAAVALALMPAASFGMGYGNLSLAVSGLVVAGLLLWPRAPLTAGGLLGLSIAVKPLAPVAVLALAVHRPEESEAEEPDPIQARPHFLAAAMALFVAGSLILSFPYLKDVLGQAEPDLASRTVSFHRFPYVLGLRLHPAMIFGAVAAATAVLARWRPLPRYLFLSLALAGTLAATPLVWSHTLILTLPIQALALQVAWWRFQESRRNAGRGEPSLEEESLRRKIEPAFVLLAIAAIQFSAGATGIDDQATWLQLVGTLPPALAPGLLTGYLFATVGQPRTEAETVGGAPAEKRPP